MKYTIELTEKQVQRVNDILLGLNESWGYPKGTIKLEPIRTTNVEDTIEYQIGYKVGYEDGNKIADKDLKEIQESTYDVAYNKGLEDAREAILNLLEVPLDEWGIVFDYDSYYIEAILEHYTISEIIERIKAYEEKKKAEEEIKVGDEVISFSDSKAIVTMVDDEWVTVIFEDGSSGEFPRNNFRKTGRHFDEIAELFSKLECADGGMK